MELIGRYLEKVEQLPPAPVVAVDVELHHLPPADTTEHTRLAAVVNFANCLAHQLLDDPSQTPKAAQASPQAVALVELKETDIPALEREVIRTLPRVERLLQIRA